MGNQLSETEREAIADLVASPGWYILWDKVVKDGLVAANLAVMQHVRLESYAQASRSVGRYEGGLNVALDAYRSIKQSPPEFIRSLMKGDTNGPDRPARSRESDHT